MPHAFWTSFLEHKEQMEKFEEQLRTRSGIRLVQRGKLPDSTDVGYLSGTQLSSSPNLGASTIVMAGGIDHQPVVIP
jgi:hypothetical protein